MTGKRSLSTFYDHNRMGSITDTQVISSSGLPTIISTTPTGSADCPPGAVDTHSTCQAGSTADGRDPGMHESALTVILPVGGCSMNYVKTAVSVPNDLFEGGEQAAAELGVSRSELYVRALRALLRERKLVAARARLDAALALAGEEAIAGITSEARQGLAGGVIQAAADRGESMW